MKGYDDCVTIIKKFTCKKIMVINSSIKRLKSTV